MKVKFIVISRHLFPDASSKIRAPVARNLPVFPIYNIEIFPIRSVWIFHGFFEPFMLTGTMIDDQVHKDGNPALLRFRNQFLHIFHGSKHRINGIVIRNVVAVIHHRRLKHRRYPQNINPKILDIVQLADYPLDISNPIPVGIIKAFWINLVCGFIMPPFSFHKTLLSILTELSYHVYISDYTMDYIHLFSVKVKKKPLLPDLPSFCSSFCLSSI